jgi:DMSO reductase anchor subunit
VHPQFSVIFLTTLIGAGQGLLLALFAAELGELVGLVPAQDPHWFYMHGSAIAFLVTGAGLAASFFHLGRPARAWRSAARWRTSWLSREVIVLPAFMGVTLLYGIAHLLGPGAALATLPSGAPVGATLVLGATGTLLAIALYVCTGMIYACLPFLREWASPLTVINFVLLGCASGFALAAAFATLTAPLLVRFYTASALILTLLGFASRSASLVRNARLRPKSTLQTAIGIKHPRIVQKAQGFMGGSFNTREFFHGRSVAVMRLIRRLFIIGTFVLPALLLGWALAGASNALIFAAFVVQYLGLLAERWYFFAQSNHPQNLYYQAIA